MVLESFRCILTIMAPEDGSGIRAKRTKVTLKRWQHFVNCSKMGSLVRYVQFCFAVSNQTNTATSSVNILKQLLH